MLRREVLALAAILGLLGLPAAAPAQQAGKVYRIGLLRLRNIPVNKSFWDTMRGLGWTEGENVRIEPSYADSPDQLGSLAADLALRQPDLIVTIGGPSTRAAKAATQTIPILFSVTDDPTELGLVPNLAKPGGNLTGFAYFRSSAKMVEMLKRALPNVMRIAVPLPDGLQYGPKQPQIVAVEAALAVKVLPLIVASTQEMVVTPARARKEGFDALMLPDVSWPFAVKSAEVTANALTTRMPTISFERRFADDGGLMSYGPIQNQHWERLAYQADKIFRGTKPADIPVEQATRFELVINLKTAKALGITIAPSVLALADDVIR